MAVEILMPALSPTMHEGTLAKWHVKEGDTISAGDVIAEIETDKASMEVEAVDEGVLGKIIINEGSENVTVNTIIALILEDGEDKSVLDNYQNQAIQQIELSPSLEKQDEIIPSSTAKSVSPSHYHHDTNTNTKKRIFASPLAKRIAAQNHIMLENLTGSGPYGRIIKKDVESAIQKIPSNHAQISPQDKQNLDKHRIDGGINYDLIPLNTMRKTIAKRLVQAKQEIPHFYLSIDCHMDKILAMRQELNNISDGSYKISVNDMIIKATATAMKDVPDVNCAYSDDGIMRYHHQDIAVAVAIDGGLITPVLRHVGERGLKDISTDMKNLATRAKEGKLLPEEYSGGGMSISNLGMYGITNFSAVINPPMACILAIGATEERVIANHGKIEIAQMMTVTISTDHRAVDGALAAQFMHVFKKIIENPSHLLL